MKEENPILLVDCHSICYSSMYRFGSFSHNGEGTGIIYGFLKQILSLAKKFETNKFIFAWDSATSKRKDDYPEYKANRLNRFKKPEEEKQFKEMIKQREILKNHLLPNIGFMNSHEVENFEADDIIAYFSKRIPEPTVIISGDNDLYQLLGMSDMFSITKKKVYTSKDLYKEYKLYPHQWAYAKAIGGCQGDNVKGIIGVADPKNKHSKAIKYITGELTSGKIYDKIKASAPLIGFTYSLVKLPHFDFNAKLILRRDKITKEKLLKVFFHYNFESFLNEEFNTWKNIFIGE